VLCGPILCKYTLHTSTASLISLYSHKCRRTKLHMADGQTNGQTQRQTERKQSKQSLNIVIQMILEVQRYGSFHAKSGAILWFILVLKIFHKVIVAVVAGPHLQPTVYAGRQSQTKPNVTLFRGLYISIKKFSFRHDCACRVSRSACGSSTATVRCRETR